MIHANDNAQPALRFLSVCSGIEAASVAWRELNWSATAFSEIEKFPSAVLAYRYPTVPNLGDFTKIQTRTPERLWREAGNTVQWKPDNINRRRRSAA
jgi:DNA (cytosine-5)-methyltransferase 1